MSPSKLHCVVTSSRKPPQGDVSHLRAPQQLLSHSSTGHRACLPSARATHHGQGQDGLHVPLDDCQLRHGPLQVRQGSVAPVVNVPHDPALDRLAGEILHLKVQLQNLQGPLALPAWWGRDESPGGRAGSSSGAPKPLLGTRSLISGSPRGPLSLPQPGESPETKPQPFGCLGLLHQDVPSRSPVVSCKELDRGAPGSPGGQRCALGPGHIHGGC